MRKRGKDHHGWKGGKFKTGSGYYQVLVRNHPLVKKNGYILEHRLVACEEWGVEAVRGMIVHHINGNITDNRIENLEILSIQEHTSRHRRKENSLYKKIGEPNSIIECACGCGIKILKFNKWGIRRKYIHHHGARKSWHFSTKTN